MLALGTARIAGCFLFRIQYDAIPFDLPIILVPTEFPLNKYIDDILLKRAAYKGISQSMLHEDVPPRGVGQQIDKLKPGYIILFRLQLYLR